MTCPGRRARGTTLPTLVVIEAKHGLLQRVVSNSGNKSSLLRHVEIGERCFKFELRRVASKANIGRLTIYFTAFAKRSCYQAKSIDSITLAAIVFAGEYGVSSVNYFFASATTISPDQRQLLFDS